VHWGYAFSRRCVGRVPTLPPEKRDRPNRSHWSFGLRRWPQFLYWPLSFLVDGSTKISASFHHVPVGAVYGVLFAGFVGTIGAYGLWSKLLASRPASEVAPYSLLVPFFGISSAWLFLNERPAAAELIGAAVMILGVAIVSGLRFPSRFVPSRLTRPKNLDHRDDDHHPTTHDTHHDTMHDTHTRRSPIVDDVNASLVATVAD
jgi:EamA-like transporter family